MNGLGSLFVRMAASGIKQDAQPVTYQPAHFIYQECPDCQKQTPHARKVGFYECVECQRRIYVVKPIAADQDSD